MSAMDHAKSFLNIVRTLQLDDIRAQLAQVPLALLIADDTRAAQQFAFLLAGTNVPDEATARATMTVASPEALESLAMGPTPYDVVLLLDPTPETRRNRGLQRLIADRGQVAALALYTRPPTMQDPGLPSLSITRLDDPVAVAAVRTRIVALLPQGRRLAWGKTFAGFRRPISDLLVNETARANAQFAIMADLGARIPIFGIAATGADFLVLTKNQLVLAYQLAAMHGRELDDPRSIFTNAAPYFLAGLGWREVARRAVRFVPGAPLVPKVAIAYGGTMVSGALARALARPEGVQAWVDGVQNGWRDDNGRFARVRRQAGVFTQAVQDRVPRPSKMKARVAPAEPPIMDTARIVNAEPPVEVVRGE